ncbi:MAG: DUF1727 domain-containing protein, partial [Acidimicrobiaceae bacterium]|nr:DUF1727 domain-containing protein [Acidimicrobiaceae bacterium]
MKHSGLNLKLQIAIIFANAGSWLVRTLSLGEGATLPGRILLYIYPRAIRDLSFSLPTVLLSGTNAKTTTTALTNEALSGSYSIVSNETGANMEGGIAYSLARHDTSAGSKSLGVFEVDEAYLPIIGAELGAKIVALLNLSRDQLDRVSETRMTSAKWRVFLETNPSIQVVANCDDPLVVYAATPASFVFWVSAGLNFRQDAHSCPVCGEEIEFEGSNWSCACGFIRPSPDAEVSGSKINVAGQAIEIELMLPGRCNIANAAIALSICHLLGVDLNSAARRMSLVAEVVGRYKRVLIDGHEVRMLLSKNPA